MFTRRQAEFSRGVGQILQACDPNSPENGPGRVCNWAEFTRSHSYSSFTYNNIYFHKIQKDKPLLNYFVNPQCQDA